MPGHARAVDKCKKHYVVGVSKVVTLIIPLPIKLERHRMKRLTEWINLIAAVIRLFSVISRTGWF